MNFSCPFSTTKSTAVVKKGAAMDTFTERTDLPGVLFLAGEPSFLHGLLHPATSFQI